MTVQDVAAAMRRLGNALQRRPELGLKDDLPASTRWESGLRIVARHPNGTTIETDLSREMGGSGEHVSPGWLFRASLASCAATRIAMAAAEEDIELSLLEVDAASRTDARGLLGMTDAAGHIVQPHPQAFELRVRIAAEGVDPERLQRLVEKGHALAPFSGAVSEAVPLRLSIEVASLQAQT